MENTFTDTELNLEILAEEASEIMEVLSRIIRMKSKIARFGLHDHHPKNHKQNLLALEEEIGHFESMRDILIDQDILSPARINAAKQEKKRTLGYYYFPMRESNIEPLSCGLCGKTTQGRQWPNAMKGCGICPSCYSWLKTEGNIDPEHLRNCYGDEGYHFNIQGE